MFQEFLTFVLPMLQNFHIHVINSNKIQQWVEFINYHRIGNLTSPVESITVDFCEVTFLHAHHIVSLACMLEEYHRAGVVIHFTKCETPVKKYLDELNFYDYWTNIEYDRSLYMPCKVNRAICGWQVVPDMISSYVDYAKKYFQDQFFVGKDLTPLHVVISEILNNIVDHSESSLSGYIMIQYRPGEYLEVAICDMGIGIPDKVNKFFENNSQSKLPNNEALEQAIVKGFSTKSTDRNMGLGLDSLSTIVKANKGRLSIISNNAIYRKVNTPDDDSPVVSVMMDQSFQGTLIVATLDAAELQKLDSEEFVFNEEYKF